MSDCVDYGVFEHSPSMEELAKQGVHFRWNDLLKEIGGSALLAG